MTSHIVKIAVSLQYARLFNSNIFQISNWVRNYCINLY